MHIYYYKVAKVKSKHGILDRALCGNNQNVITVCYCYKKHYLGCIGGPAQSKTNIYLVDKFLIAYFVGGLKKAN